MTKRNLTLVAAALILLIVAGGAFAQTQTPGTNATPGRSGHFGHARHHMFQHMAKQLQLTDAQQAQIKTMWQAQKTTLKPLFQQLANGRQQMMTATAGGAFDQAKVTAIAQQQSLALTQLIVEKEKLQSQIYNQVLTSEQRVKADQMRQQHTQRMQNWLNKPASSSTSNQ